MKNAIAVGIGALMLITLLYLGLTGLAPAMPAKGMCFACSDDDMRSLVDYMVAHSR